MIQTVKDLINSVKEYTTLCHIDQRVCTAVMQKIYSSPHYIVVSARLPGKTLFLYIGRGQNYEGLFIGKKNIPSKYRIRDRFIEFVRKYLQGGIIHSISVENEDRLMKIAFTKRALVCEFFLFWKGRELFFAYYEKSDEGKRVFRSWSGWEVCFEDIFVKEIFYALDVGSNKAEREAKGDFNEEHYIASLEENVDIQTFPKRKKKFFQRKLVNIETDLKKVKKWREMTELIQSELFVIPLDYEFKICGIKFKIDTGVNQFKRRDIIYKKIKSFKLAEVILEKRLADTSTELKKWINGDVFVVKGLGKTIEPVWKSIKVDRKDQVMGVNKKIIDLGNGLRIAIGLDSKSNDWLRNSWAKKEDFWFHIDGETSCHIFLKNPKDISVDSKVLELIGSALREFSSYGPTQIPVVFTQVKNLKPVKGASGKVIFKKEKRIDIQFLDKWKERISIIS